MFSYDIEHQYKIQNFYRFRIKSWAYRESAYSSGNGFLRAPESRLLVHKMKPHISVQWALCLEIW